MGNSVILHRPCNLKPCSCDRQTSNKTFLFLQWGSIVFQRAAIRHLLFPTCGHVTIMVYFFFQFLALLQVITSPRTNQYWSSTTRNDPGNLLYFPMETYRTPLARNALSDRLLCKSNPNFHILSNFRYPVPLELDLGFRMSY